MFHFFQHVFLHDLHCTWDGGPVVAIIDTGVAAGETESRRPRTGRKSAAEGFHKLGVPQNCGFCDGKSPLYG